MAAPLPPEVEASLEAWRRPAWFPVVVDGDTAGTAASKFSGTPQLGDGEAWPKCGCCGRSMQMFVQLRLAELPEAVREEFGSGLLQMFLCTTGDCDDGTPFSSNTLVRIVPESEKEGMTASIPEDILDFFPPSTIVGWTEVADYPNPWEREDYSQKLKEWQEWETVLEERNRNRNRNGTKLSGWPWWVQAPGYPSCPVCQQTMRFVFQIDSEDKVPYMFGDSGCGYITQCPSHKDQLTFEWSCF